MAKMAIAKMAKQNHGHQILAMSMAICWSILFMVMALFDHLGQGHGNAMTILTMAIAMAGGGHLSILFMAGVVNNVIIMRRRLVK